jgi:hypothetical protein
VSSGKGITLFALALLIGDSILSRSNNHDILVTTVGSLRNVHLLVVPVKDKVSSPEDGVAENLLVGGDDDADVTLCVTHLDDEIAEGNTDNLVAKAKVGCGVAIPVVTIGDVEALTVVLHIKHLKNRLRSLKMQTGKCAS